MANPLMRALLTSDHRIEIETVVAAPTPGPGEVVVDVAYNGICGTDLHLVRGDMDHRLSFPAVIGHEMSGRIAQVGAGVDTHAVGDPVAVMPLDSCGTCRACGTGHRHVCERLRFLGIESPGALQSQWTVPAHAVMPVPDDVPLAHAALSEPTAVAVHDVRRAHLAAGERVLVVGAGPIGLLVSVIARREGAEVTVCDTNEHRLGVAQRLGFATSLPADLDAEADADVAFEVSGTHQGLASALTQLAVRGRLVVVGIHATPPTVDMQRVFLRELVIVGARVYEPDDFSDAIRLIAEGAIPADDLITGVVPLIDSAAAFHSLEQGGDQLKILIDCGGAVP